MVGFFREEILNLTNMLIRSIIHNYRTQAQLNAMKPEQIKAAVLDRNKSSKGWAREEGITEPWLENMEKILKNDNKYQEIKKEETENKDWKLRWEIIGRMNQRYTELKENYAKRPKTTRKNKLETPYGATESA